MWRKTFYCMKWRISELKCNIIYAGTTIHLSLGFVGTLHKIPIRVCTH